jgi:aminopeptidase N
VPSLSLDESRRRADLLQVTSYVVALDLSGDDQVFDSTTTITFTAREAGETFLDVKPRTLRSVRLDGQPLDVDALAGERLPLVLEGGDHELVVDAVMAYRNDGEGLHRAVDPADGRPYTYAMSFLDAAPSVFACFDQPDLKAPYTVSVLAPEDWLVRGNGRARQVEPGQWELATTQPLSTYFVTLVGGPYSVLESEHDGIRLGLVARRSLARHLDREADELFTVTGECFDEFHRLFGVRYAFGDYTQAFVPEFNAGAMENPGCVTFRDSMVFSSKVTRFERGLRASTIAHEMAHQWFGNLVTMQWWDDLWLNESFAEYVGHRVTAEATDFSDAWVDMAYRRKRWGVEADQRPTTHPVAGTGADSAAAALQDFDGISYAKGSAVLRQLNARLGDDVFLTGVRDHFARHRFGNAGMRDLFSSWERAGAADLAPWTQAWLRTAGLDLLSVERPGDTQEPPTLVRRTPPERPAVREHAIAVAVHREGLGWQAERLMVRDDRTPLPSAVALPVVLDPAQATWARFRLDDLTLEAMPRLLPDMADPLMRAAVWNAVWDSVTDARVAPETVLRLAEAAVPSEDHDLGVAAVSQFAVETVAKRMLQDGDTSLSRVHRAASDRLRTAEPGSGVQLAAMRAAVASCTDEDLLLGWLCGADLPDGVDMDLDLRWKALARLSVMGRVDREELQRRFQAEPTAEAQVHHTRCLASLPDEEAKRYAWDRFTGAVPASNYDIEAAGLGMWQPGQETLTDPYVDRYFAEVTDTVSVRTGWVLADAARAFFPRFAVSAQTVAAAHDLLGGDLDVGLRRALADETDDLERVLRVRETFVVPAP